MTTLPVRLVRDKTRRVCGQASHLRPRARLKGTATSTAAVAVKAGGDDVHIRFGGDCADRVVGETRAVE